MPKLQNNPKNMNNYEVLVILFIKSKLSQQTQISLISMMTSSRLTSRNLVSKDVFLIEEQLCKSVSQLVER